MGQHILVPFDGSPQATAALEYALDTFPDGEVTVLNVIHLGERDLDYQTEVVGFNENWYENATEYAEEVVAAAADLATEAGATVETVTEFGRPSRTIVDYVEEHDVDHVVMGSHGRQGVSRVLIGSVAETVVRRSPVPVTVVR